MWARALVATHLEPTDDCPGGTECEDTETVTFGLFMDAPLNVVDRDASYEEQLVQTIRNMCAGDERVREGHWFKIEIHP